MKKTLQILSAAVALVFTATSITAQTAPKTPQKKGFLIEKGTGYMCGSCPAIEERNLDAIGQHPKGQGMMVLYHIGSADTRPQGGQLNKDYTTRFGDSIYPISGTPLWPFYLNMQINRRYKGTLASTTFFTSVAPDPNKPDETHVHIECNSVAVETAPVNIDVVSSYNSTTREVTANVQLYYTANSATSKNYVQVILTEDNVVGPQTGVNGASGFVYNYVHNDLFRANMSKAFGEQGEEITTTTAGTTVNKTFKYTVPAKYGEWYKQNTNYTSAQTTANPLNFKLTVYVCEARNASGAQALFGKIINVVRAPLGGSVITDIEEEASVPTVSVYPNPSAGVFYLSAANAGNTTYEVYDVTGKRISTGKVVSNTETVDLSAFEKGAYFIRVNSEKAGITTHKVMLVD